MPKNHRNRTWRASWVLDRAACTATHADGFTVSFEIDTGQLPPQVGGRCWSGEKQWFAKLEGGQNAAIVWLRVQQARTSASTEVLTQKMATHMRRAGELWVQEMKDSH